MRKNYFKKIKFCIFNKKNEKKDLYVNLIKDKGSKWEKKKINNQSVTNKI
jgi:hypothetical protein